MNENFFIIKKNYKNELENYTDLNNLDDLGIGCHIKYFSKKNLKKKSGFLKSVKENSILELYLPPNKKWFIYIKDYYIFYKIIEKNSFKTMLKNLIENDFNLLKK